MGKPLPLEKGITYEELTILSKAPSKRHPSGRTSTRCNVQCSCGVEKEVDLNLLRKGRIVTCGTHNKSKDLMYPQWASMKMRSKQRLKNGEACYIYPPWLKCFYTWKRDNASGWKKGLCFCRNNDKGNYEPNNVRWDTHKNNLIEAKEDRYKVEFNITSPTGEEYFNVINLKKFCLKHNINVSGLQRVAKGLQKKGHYKGWKCIKLEKGD